MTTIGDDADATAQFLAAPPLGGLGRAVDGGYLVS
jgi:hypothetical protein